MIKPTAKDIGRRVKLPRFNGTALFGVLKEIMAPDMSHTDPFGMVVYGNDRMAIATYLDKLDWADGEGSGSAETGGSGSRGP